MALPQEGVELTGFLALGYIFELKIIRIIIKNALFFIFLKMNNFCQLLIFRLSKISQCLSMANKPASHRQVTIFCENRVQ
jgi:hypothetical protein